MPRQVSSHVRALGRPGALVASALFVTACFEPIQGGSIEVIGNPEDRLATICRFRQGDPATKDVCPQDAAPVQPSRAARIEAPSELLAGPFAAGRVGDYVLENSEVAIVIDQLGRGQGFAEGGGQIVDAADATARVDAIGQMFASTGAFPRQAVYENLRSGADTDGTAWIEVEGKDLLAPAIRVTTRYALAPGSRAVAITTKLQNTGKDDVAGLDLGDVIQWGGAQKGAPGKDLGFRGDATGPFLFGIGMGVSYAIVPEAGAVVASKNGGAWSNTTYVRGLGLAAGATGAFTRHFIVGRRGDTAAIASETLVPPDAALGAVTFEIVDTAGRPVRWPNESRLALQSSEASGWSSKVPFALWLRPATDGTLWAELPEGKFTAEPHAKDGWTATEKASVEVKAGEVRSARIVVSPGAFIVAQVTEIDATGAQHPTPAKVTIMREGSDERAAWVPILPNDRERPALVAPGRYRVIASRGPEFSIDEAIVEAKPDATERVALRISRVIDTKGYIACDLHQHTIRSFDASATVPMRVASNAIEGVECAVASEHNAITDLGPAVAQLSLGAFFKSISGVELTSDASRAPFGHLNAFPMTPNANDSRGGAPTVRDRTAAEVLNEVRGIAGDRVLQVNHPRLGTYGYFDQLGFDRSLGKGTGAGYDERFDALEVWSGRHAEERDRVLADLWALLASGRPVTPTANTDTHGIENDEPGYPRTWIAVTDESPAMVTTDDLVAGLKKRRDVVLSNGPFLTARIGETGPGGIASIAKAKRAELSVHVERAAWVDATELQIWVGGALAASVPLDKAVKNERGALTFDVKIPIARTAAPKTASASKTPTLHAPGDTFVVAIVRGSRSLAPVLAGDAKETAPFAMTSPIWIDADGDGRALGR